MGDLRVGGRDELTLWNQLVHRTNELREVKELNGAMLQYLRDNGHAPAADRFQDRFEDIVARYRDG